MCKCMLVAVIALLLPLTAIAQETKPTTAVGGTLLTIYSSARLDDFDASKLMKGNQNALPGLLIVQQRRTFELNEGESTIELGGIAPAADFPTVSLRPAAADSFKVLSQSLTEASSDPDTLLRRAIGHEVIINRKASALGERGRTPETTNAKLLAFDQNQLVVETGNRQLPVQIIPRNSEIAEIKLMADSAAGTTHSALSVRVSSGKGGAQEGILTYHSGGITWHADYDIFLRDESKASFTGTITMLNRTGASYEDAHVNLIAAAQGLNLTTASRRIAEDVGRQSYSLPQPISLAADAAHRVSLVDVPSISCQIVLGFTPADFSHSPTSASNYLAIENTSKNALGSSLPPGRARITKQPDANAAPILMADDILPSAAPNDTVLLRLGTPSQVRVKREIIERLEADRTANVQTIQLTLRNGSDHAQKVLMVEPRPPATSEILEKTDEYQLQSHSLLFSVQVPANGEKVISYSVRHPAQ